MKIGIYGNSYDVEKAEHLNYDTIESFDGDIIIFTSNILPYSFFDANYDNLFSLNNQSWIRQIGKGYFVKLYSRIESPEQIKKAIEIGVKIAQLH